MADNTPSHVPHLQGRRRPIAGPRLPDKPPVRTVPRRLGRRGRSRGLWLERQRRRRRAGNPVARTEGAADPARRVARHDIEQLRGVITREAVVAGGPQQVICRPGVRLQMDRGSFLAFPAAVSSFDTWLSKPHGMVYNGVLWGSWALGHNVGWGLFWAAWP